LEIPLCTFCVKSGILCQRCQEKVRKGEISETAINMAKLLLKLENKFPVLQKIKFYDAFEIENVVAIILGVGDIHRLLSSGGGILRAIGEDTGKKIKILENRGDTRKFFEDLFTPISVTSINKIWLPDGSTETRVVLSGYYRRLPMKASVIKKLAKKIRGITLRIGFENSPGKEI